MIENKKTVVIEKEGPASETFENFTEALPKDAPRYALVDVEYKAEDGRDQTKLCFFMWSPDDKAGVKDKMLYASSKDAMKKKFPGIMKEVQSNDRGDLDFEKEILPKMRSK